MNLHVTGPALSHLRRVEDASKPDPLPSPPSDVTLICSCGERTPLPLARVMHASALERGLKGQYLTALCRGCGRSHRAKVGDR